MFGDDEMQENFQRNFFRRPIARRSFYLGNFIALPEVYNVFEFQGWGDFLRISEDIYTRAVLTFYSTLNAYAKDHISLKSIARSSELQVLLSDIAKITNTPNDGILCHGKER